MVDSLHLPIHPDIYKSMLLPTIHPAIFPCSQLCPIYPFTHLSTHPHCYLPIQPSNPSSVLSTHPPIYPSFVQLSIHPPAHSLTNHPPLPSSQPICQSSTHPISFLLFSLRTKSHNSPANQLALGL